MLVRRKDLQVFLNGVLVAFVVIFYTHWNYLNQQVTFILNATISPSMSDEEKVLSLLKKSNEIFLFGVTNIGSDNKKVIQRSPMRTFDEAFMLPQGACGDATGVLYRLLSDAGFETRIAQMSCGDAHGCHIILESLVNGKWVVLDALYGLAFRNKKNELSSFAEVSSDWEFFKSQTPPEYDPVYRYDAVRYTNWTKIPVLMPAIKVVLDLVKGKERADQISLRKYFMRTTKVYLLLSFSLLIVLNVGLSFARWQPKATSQSTERKAA